MPVRVVAVDQIKPAPYNPRVDLKPGQPRYERIARSLDRFGLVDPLVWNEATGNLVGGHQRFKILVARGAKDVECSVVNLSLDEEKALNLILNSPDIEGEWDEAVLKRVLEEVEAQLPDTYDELELALLGRMEFAEDALGKDKGGDQAEDEAVAGDDDAPGPPAMELLPYEHYDYIMLMFKDSRDFISAMDHFGLQRVSVPAFVGSKKIGLGRVIDGAKYVNRIKKELEGKSSGVVQTNGGTPPPETTAPQVIDTVEAADQAVAEAEDRVATGKKKR